MIILRVDMSTNELLCFRHAVLHAINGHEIREMSVDSQSQPFQERACADCSKIHVAEHSKPVVSLKED